jgi:hypothetical protein
MFKLTKQTVKVTQTVVSGDVGDELSLSPLLSSMKVGLIQDPISF